MESWRKERDALVSALEVQLQKLLTSQAEKDQLIQQLRCNEGQPQAEVGATPCKRWRFMEAAGADDPSLNAVVHVLEITG